MPVPDPVAFTVFHIDIMWYAILISCGIILATVICCVRAPKHGLTSDHILNFVIICVPAGIIGARLYYVLFHWDWYAGDFFDIINIRAGGLAIHGGLIAGLGTAALLCYFWKIRSSLHCSGSVHRTLGQLLQFGSSRRAYQSSLGHHRGRAVRPPHFSL